jgi:hypothetical protein
MSPMTDPADAPDVWRVRPAARVGAVILVTAMLAVAVGVSVGGEAASVQLVLWAVVVLLSLGVWRWSFAPYIELTLSEVVIQNPLVRRTVGYSEVDEVRSGIGGLEVKRRAGKPIAVWAVQKSTWARPSRRSARIDEVAEAIRDRLTA